MELTLNDITEYLGQPRTKIGRELIWQCPYCLDEHKDNLHYNPNKNVLWCFADASHNRQILSEIMKKKHESKKMESKEIPAYIKHQEQYLYYMELCNSALLGTLTKDWIDFVKEQNMFEENECAFYLDLIQSANAEKARTYLKSQRGINYHTIELTGLGFDFKARKWVIPIFNMNCEIVGFRYRGADFKQKKVWTEKGTPKTLARFYGADTSKTLYIGEGEWDCIILTQWLLENKQKDFMVVSPSNGASSLLSVIPQIKLNKFDKIKLILDNDTAGDKATEEIIKKYPMIIDSRDFLKSSNINDTNDFYLRKVVKQ
ncbi:MAG: toprim domain-containing protein [Candidatus Gastranaerophilaceae bacterium]